MLEDIRTRLKDAHFAFVDGGDMRAQLEAVGSLSDWDAFEASWNALPDDTYMADGGRYRKRRHGVFQGGAEGAIVRRPDQPHYQSRDRNPLNGGIQRWFAPVTREVADGDSLKTILSYCRNLFHALQPETEDWHIETHQFRIIARPGEQGRPTPEGMHRDGVDFVLVMLIDRNGVKSGVTTIADLDQKPLGSFTLQHPFEVALVDDRHVYHGVTPIEPVEGYEDAHRDVLVVTWVDRSRAVRETP